ncbi:hypothetical protein J5Y03_09085 [Bacillus sp. RG28]|uniref:Uncharacterized protein n=1 Tax=Gottfriedia endophytica TaxID=2820819 RepID=A0A940SGQ7_9BACI|nr:hypothetical protein [Gottfriedia endophytica]MBP0725342.1 hypothetical protein [Gottfriedia endophytica]
MKTNIRKEHLPLSFQQKMEVTLMKKDKNLISKEQMTITANLNNLEPGDSVDKHRAIEAGNIILAAEEIKQQNNNL